MIKRNTIQRALVLEAVNDLRCHATAEEIYQHVVRDHPNISKATVYRNLNQLAENGDIRPVEIPGEPERFDHMLHPHYHVQCLSCRRIFDVDMEYIPDLTSRILSDQGFDFLGHQIIIQGLCPDCKNTSVKEK